MPPMPLMILSKKKHFLFFNLILFRSWRGSRVSRVSWLVAPWTNLCPNVTKNASMELQIKWKANPKIRQDVLSQQHSRQRILGIFATHTLTVGLPTTKTESHVFLKFHRWKQNFQPKNDTFRKMRKRQKDLICLFPSSQKMSINFPKKISSTPRATSWKDLPFQSLHLDPGQGKSLTGRAVDLFCQQNKTRRLSFCYVCLFFLLGLNFF